MAQTTFPSKLYSYHLQYPLIVFAIAFLLALIVGV